MLLVSPVAGSPMALSSAVSCATVILVGVSVSGPSPAQCETNSLVTTEAAMAFTRPSPSDVSGSRGWQICKTTTGVMSEACSCGRG